MKDLKEENKKLYQRIDELRQEQLNLEAQVQELQEEVAAEYLRYRDECDARKLLVADINDLKYQQEDVLMSKKNAKDEEEKDDPITLRIALKFVFSSCWCVCFYVMSAVITGGVCYLLWQESQRGWSSSLQEIEWDDCQLWRCHSTEGFWGSPEAIQAAGTPTWDTKKWLQSLKEWTCVSPSAMCMHFQTDSSS